MPPTSGTRPIAHSGMATWRGLADDAVAAVAGDADAAAHDEALHQRDVGLRVAAMRAFIRYSSAQKRRPWSKSPRRPVR